MGFLHDAASVATGAATGGPVGAGAALIGSIGTNIFNALEARSNRRFQERMSNTAHQREAEDMRLAGINPQMSARLGGASTPGGAAATFENPTASAIAAKLAQAQLGEIQARTNLARANAETVDAVRSPALDKLIAERDRINVGIEMDRKNLNELMPALISKAREEVGLTANSARAALARAKLDEAAETGAINLQEFEKTIGQAGPWVKAVFKGLEMLGRFIPR